MYKMYTEVKMLTTKQFEACSGWEDFAQMGFISSGNVFMHMVAGFVHCP